MFWGLQRLACATWYAIVCYMVKCREFLSPSGPGAAAAAQTYNFFLSVLFVFSVPRMGRAPSWAPIWRFSGGASLGLRRVRKLQPAWLGQKIFTSRRRGSRSIPTSPASSPSSARASAPSSVAAARFLLPFSRAMERKERIPPNYESLTLDVCSALDRSHSALAHAERALKTPTEEYWKTQLWTNP